jgi:GABA(A) receptor-associated protein
MIKRNLTNKQLSFSNRYKFNERVQEATRVLSKYPERIPVICEKNAKCVDLNNIVKEKYLVFPDLTCGQFMYIIRRSLSLPAEKAVFMMINGIIPSNTDIMYELYEKHKDSDGFLYITYTSENVFGESFVCY